MREHKSVKGRAMARARTIRPGIMTNEVLGELGKDAYILFTGLWMLADREGRLEDRPRRIKIEAMGLWDDVSTEDVEKLLKGLAEKGFIRRYEVHGKKCICVNEWQKHQHPHPREAPSIIPPHTARKHAKRPPKQVSTFEMSASRQGLGNALDMPRTDPGTTLGIPRDSTSPSGSSGSSGSSCGGHSTVIERVSTTDICASGDARVGAKSAFQEFWSERWRSEGKIAAQKAFVKFADTPEHAAAIIAAVRKQKPKMLQFPKDKRPYMVAWLDKQRFEDDEELPELAEVPRILIDDMREKAAMDMLLKLTKGKYA